MRTSRFCCAHALKVEEQIIVYCSGLLSFSCLSVASLSSNCMSSMGFGGGVVAMVHPIQAPIASTAMNAMSTGIVTSHSRMASKAGQKSAKVYANAMTTQRMQISPPRA